jgi:hypothetical protein
MKREARRLAAQFLNGLAIAILAAGAIGPAASGAINMTVFLAALVGAGALHALAIALVT